MPMIHQRDQINKDFIGMFIFSLFSVTDVAERRSGAKMAGNAGCPLLPPVVSECALEVGRRIATP